MNLSRLTAVITALISFLADMVVELMLKQAPLNGVSLIPEFADLRYAWNRGVSFSLFSQHSIVGNWILSFFLAAIVIVLSTIAWRTSQQFMAVGLGLIIGGALGNLSDRVLHGAVFDFLYLHAGQTPFFVCNTADIMISAGVLCLALARLQDTR